MNARVVATLRSPRGSALLVALAILFVVSLVAMVSLETSRVEVDIAGNNVRRSQALLAAEAGLAETDAILKVSPQQRNAATLMTQINAQSQLANTSYQVAMESTLPLRKVISLGKGAGSEAAIQVTYRYGYSTYNIWNNALFAGHGKSGKAIRGNASIHGSIHILGDGEDFVDQNGNFKWDAGEPFTDANHDGVYAQPLTSDSVALALSGTATVGNNYNGMSSTLRSKVPTLATSPFEGEDVQSLLAEVRVKRGLVTLDGSSQIGSPNAKGGSPAVKETMDGIWTNDGIAGSAGTGSIYSDNGVEEHYDFSGEAKGPSMPNLDDPYTDQDGVSHATYLAYLKSKSLVLKGDLKLQCGATRPLVSDAHGSISMDGSGNLVASGIIYVEGNIAIDGSCPILYSGKFTLVSEGNTLIDVDFLSKGKFTVDDAAGIVSYGRIDLGEDASQLKIAGAFFAQNEVRATKQTEVAGTLVSNYFSLTQVPNVYQVPNLLSNLPPDLPGSNDYYAFAWMRVPRSWVELY